MNSSQMHYKLGQYRSTQNERMDYVYGTKVTGEYLRYRTRFDSVEAPRFIIHLTLYNVEQNLDPFNLSAFNLSTH